METNKRHYFSVVHLLHNKELGFRNALTSNMT